jgi:hypothetical protein
MSKFFLKLLIFLLPLGLIFLYFEFKLRAIPNSYNIKKEYLIKNKNEIETIFLGGSHALNAFNPNYISSKSINLANASQSLYFDAKILKQQIDQLPKLKNVIFNISNCSYYYSMNESREKLRASAYKIFWGINNKPYNYFDLKNYSLATFFGPTRVVSIAKAGFKKIEDEENGSKLLFNGFLESDTIKRDSRISDSLGKVKFNYHFSMIKEQNLNQNINALNEVLQILNTRKINIYFIYTPTYKTYYNNYNKSQFVKTDSIENILVQNFNSKVFNFSQDKRFVKDDFYDNDHLNKYGAAKFSKIMDSILLNNH